MLNKHLALEVLPAEDICASQRPSDALGSILASHPLLMSAAHALRPQRR